MVLVDSDEYNFTTKYIVVVTKNNNNGRVCVITLTAILQYDNIFFWLLYCNGVRIFFNRTKNKIFYINDFERM